MLAGRRSKCALDERQDRLVGDPAGPERLDGQADRVGDPDAVGDLDLEPVGQTGGHDVLGHPARGVGRRAVDLRRILAAERAAAVTGHPAVAVDDDLPAGQAGVAHRPADHEATGRVDVHDRIDRAQLVGDRRQDDRLDDVGPDPLGADVRIVLGRDDDRPDALRDAELVLDRDLGLAVRPQVGQLAVLADLGQAAGHPVGEGDRQRHQLGRLAAGEPEHHPLVAGPELVDGRRVVADLERLVDAHRDVRRLLLDADQRAAGQVVEAVVGLRVADLADGVADDRLEVDVRARRDLAEDHDQAGGGGGLAGDPRVGIVGDDRVQDRVADLVAHLVRVTLGHRLRREQVVGGVDDAHRYLNANRRSVPPGRRDPPSSGREDGRERPRMP